MDVSKIMQEEEKNAGAANGGEPQAAENEGSAPVSETTEAPRNPNMKWYIRYKNSREPPYRFLS